MPRSPARFSGVLGWPLEHTMSPVIHNAAFRSLGIDCTYLAFPVPPESLPGAVEGLRALGALGANMTMPHKRSVIDLIDDVSGDAADIGAVNTLEIVAGRVVGHNTDIDGFAGLLTSDAGYDVAGRSALVLGSGGAARAVVRALDELGAARVTVAGRSLVRARALLGLARRAEAQAAAWEEAETLVSAADVVVNATPLGTRGGDPVPAARFRPGQVVIDLVYDPPATAMVERARSLGAGAWGGLGMLIHQAASSFRIWTGQEAPLEVMSAAALRAARG